MWQRQLLFILTLAAAVACQAGELLAAPSPGSEDARPLIPHVHTRWLVKDGAPPSIRGIAQTPDGWLWLASSAGLFRFDGVKFTQYRPPAGVELQGAVDKLGVLDDGTLWVSPRFGGLLLVRGDAVEAFSGEQGLPPMVIEAVVRDSAGHILLGNSRGVFQLDARNRRWQDISARAGLPTGSSIRHMLRDPRGGVWLLCNKGVFFRAPGTEAFERLADQHGDGRLRLAPDGSVWASDAKVKSIRRLWPRREGDAPATLADDMELNEYLFDRKGNIWFPELNGLMRVQREGKQAIVQAFRQRHGLSGRFPIAVFEDRENTIWVSTATGLDQFRPSRMRALSLPSYTGEARPMAAGAAGELWIDHVYLPHADAIPQAFAPASTLGTMTTVVYRSPQGEVWRADYDGLWRVQGLVSSRVPLPAPFASRRPVPIFSLAEDAGGGLWASFGPAGIWRFDDGIWTPHGGVAQLRDFAAISIVAGAEDTLWFASPLKQLAVLRDGIVRRFGASDGLAIGGVLHVSPVGKGAYLGGEGGMAYFDGERFLPFLGEGGQQFAGATGIVIAANGDLWAYTARGLVWVTAAELARSRSEPGYQPRFRRFDENDGLQSGAVGMTPIPSMVQSANGELFLSTSGNVFRFDPARLDTNRLAPPVHVTTVSADDKQYRPIAGLKLAPRPETVRIDYTALSMALPQQVRFRYRLEGIDRQWQDADTRRSAFYTQLAPGNYSFRVTAANEDGLWNQEGARVDFVVPAAPTQTLWFKLLCTAAVGLAAWLLYRVRVRAALRRHTLTLRARMAERERIARDLHDTLLQSVQGLILSFKRVANRTADPSTRLLMDQALTLAVDVLVEGRNKVGGLREGVDAGDLVVALELHGQQLSEQYGPRFRLACHGSARLLQASVFDEVLAIGREAVQNAFAHAQATNVKVELDYGSALFKMRISDDGCGIAEQHRCGRPGHWGIQGMAERASALGASLELLTQANDGCTWQLHMDSERAYVSPHRADAEPTVPDSRLGT